MKKDSVSTFVRGNRDLIKAINRNLLLNIIRREGRLSRKQLTEISGLSVGAVSGIVAELLTNGWILEVGEGDFTGGRRQTLIQLNPEAGFAIGVKLTEDRAVIATTNFESHILAYKEFPLLISPNADQLVDQLVKIIRSVIDDLKIDSQKLFGIGIGLAGVIRPAEGVVHHSPYFGWRNVPLAHLLQSQIQFPVFIENDVNTLTLTEQLFGAGRHYANFVVVTIGRGIGLGIVINHQLYNSIRNSAGELGHTVLLQHASDGFSTNFQTLENAAADPSVINSFSGSDGSPHTLKDIVALANNGNEKAIQVLGKSGELFGVGLANVVNILGPELVIVSGEGIIAGDYRLKPMLSALVKHTFDGLLNDVEIVVEPTDDKAWARGAASLVISKVFESPILEANVAS